MQIRLNRFTGRMLLMALRPFVVIERVLKRVLGPRRERVGPYVDTVAADPFAYAGARPLVVCVWTREGVIWRDGTSPIIERLREEYAGRCEFVYREAGPGLDERLGVREVPVVIVFHGGREVGRFPQMVWMGDAELRRVLEEACGGGGVR